MIRRIRRRRVPAVYGIEEMAGDKGDSLSTSAPRGLQGRLAAVLTALLALPRSLWKPVTHHVQSARPVLPFERHSIIRCTITHSGMRELAFTTVCQAFPRSNLPALNSCLPAFSLSALHASAQAARADAHSPAYQRASIQTLHSADVWFAVPRICSSSIRRTCDTSIRSRTGDADARRSARNRLAHAPTIHCPTGAEKPFFGSCEISAGSRRRA